MSPHARSPHASAARLKWYADDRGMRFRQLTRDLLVLLWCGLWVAFALAVRETVLRLQGPSRQLEGAGDGLADGLGGAADRVSGTPLIGEELAEPLDAAADAGSAVAGAGAAASDAVADLALILALVIALIPITIALLRWLPSRLAYAREAGAAVALRGDIELLALRAATSLPLRELARLGPEPVARWRRDEPGAAEELAALELHSLGVRPLP